MMMPRVAKPSPEPTGIGLRTPHYRALLDHKPDVGFVEVHSENFFGRGRHLLGGQAAHLLQQVRNDYALSLHGVGLSLGSVDIDTAHLDQLRLLVNRYQPRWVSEHLSWSGAGGVFVNDLLPLPYTEEALAIVGANIQRVQDTLQRRLLIENPSRYLAFTHSTIDETEFLGALVRTTGCGLLLDINNIYVSAENLGFDAAKYVQSLDASAVEEIHLAGFTTENDLLIDTHSRPVAAPVWSLYSQFLDLHGDRPTLIEWDLDLPDLPVLLQEAHTADRHRADYARHGAGEVAHAPAG